MRPSPVLLQRLCICAIVLAAPAFAQGGRNVTVRPLSGAPAPSGRGWGLIIGINEYKDETVQRLRFAAADAQGVFDLLTDLERGGFERANVKLLLNREATREAIILALTALETEAGPEDTVFVYFGGHGLEDGGASYLVPCDANVGILQDTAISLDRFNESLARCRAARKVIVLDACHSGALEGRRDAGLMSEDFQRRVFLEAKGRIVLSSCGYRESSYEWPEQGHGVFTYYLLEALGGAADLDNDRLVTADEAARYTCDKVREWAYQHTRRQTPQREYYSVAGDIVLACRPGGDKPPLPLTAADRPTGRPIWRTSARHRA